MASKEMEVLVKLKAQVDKLLPKNMQDLVERAKELQRQTKESQALLKRYEKNADSFKTLKKAIGDTTAQYRKNLIEIRRLKQIQEQKGRLSKKEEQQLTVLNSRQEKLRRTLEGQKGII